MRTSRRFIRFMLVAVIVLAAVGCSSIKIETGATTEEKSAVSERQARDTRVTWVNNFSQAPPMGKADLLKIQIDSTSERLFVLAGQFAREWRKGNEGRGREIPADEMQQIFDNTISSQRPILKAWEDNMEYGWEWIRDSSRFNPPLVDLFGQMVDYYYEAYSGVFYPQSDVTAYEDRNAEAQTQMRNLSDRLMAELRRTR